MHRELKPNEKLSRAVRRIARKEAHSLSERFKKRNFCVQAESVHKIRTGVKKMRAWLRLIRDRFDRRSYHEQTDGWRAIADALAPLRDVEVELETWQAMSRQYSRSIPKSERNSWRKALVAERENQLLKVTALRRRLKLQSRFARRGVESWPLKGLKKRELRSGIKRAHRRFRKALENAKVYTTGDNLHEWRKRTKDLLYQLRIVKSVGPEAVGELLPPLERLGECLGNDHDLARLEADAGKFTPRLAATLRRGIRARRAQLQQTALKLGCEISANPPALLSRWVK